MLPPHTHYKKLEFKYLSVHRKSQNITACDNFALAWVARTHIYIYIYREREKERYT